jgi:type I restriction enzyme R subunit
MSVDSEIFTFHRPETLGAWVREATVVHPEAHTLRHWLRRLPELDDRGLWPAQATAIRNLEKSLAEDRPRALIQMATGAGKTYAAASEAYW